MARKTTCVGLAQGRMMRVTALDNCGRPIVGDESVVTSKGFVSVTMTTNIEEGEAIEQTNASGDRCVYIPGRPRYTGETLEVSFCNVDPDMFARMTGQRTVVDYSGNVIGFTKDEDVSPADYSFALEVWAGSPAADVCDDPNAQGAWGYTLLPFLQGGIVGDVTIENAAVTFVVTSVISKAGNRWGSGPYNVMLDETGSEAPLADPVVRSEHVYTIITAMAPPAAMCGARPFLSPSAAEITGATATATGLSVDFQPDPAGSDPFWVEFGDGYWDYSDDGTAITYEYPSEGTYTYTVYQGKSSFTGTVTVTEV